MPTALELRALLRVELVYFAVGVLILTVGTVALAEAITGSFRKRLTMLFGFAALIYGARLLFQLGIFQFTLGIPKYTSVQIWAILCYLVPILFVYLWAFFVSPRSRKFVLMLVAAHIAVAVIGIPRDLITHRPFSLANLNNAVVIAGAILVFVLLVLDIRSGFIPFDVPIRTAAVGFILVQLCILHDNLAGFGVVPRLWTEPFGFLAFLGAMGFAIQYKIRSDRNRLTLLRGEMEQARRIQLSILPSGPPANSFYEIAANYSPMTSVAGDLYDFLPLGDSRLGLFIADVSGHGLPAALVASMLKTALTIYGRTAVGPAALLGELNRVFCGQSHGQFVTAAIAVLDGPAQTLTYSAAGHPPLLLWTAASADVQQVEQNGLPLGILTTADYTEVTVRFGKGDRLAMYTDGIVESENSRAEEFGRERLGGVLRSNHGDPRELIRRAMEAVESWRGREHEQADDLTLLVAEYKPLG